MDSARFLFLLKRMDWWLMLAALCLATVGILFIYSAGFRGDGLPVPSYYQKQMVWCCLGLATVFFLVCVDYKKWMNMSLFIYAVGLAMLILVLFVGTSAHGSSRWLNLAGIRVQPSEFAKIATLIMLARYLGQPGLNLRQYRVVLTTGLLAGVPFLLIFLEPDLGTAAVLLPMAFALMYVAGVPKRTLALIVGLGVLCLFPLWEFALGEYQQERILTFFDPGRDPRGAGWNKFQSEIAVGSGGLTGKGYLEGTQNVLGFLPRTVAPTDFIYSVIAEEMGFIGSALVLSLYAAVLIGVVRAALFSRDKPGRLLAVGVATMLFFHVTVNIAMTIGLMPITGLPLPLISYGGSFMISTMCALGLVESVYVRRYRR